MKTAITNLFSVCAAFLAAIVFSGCATPQPIAPTADDYKAAALTCLDQMYQDGVWDTFEDAPLMKVSRIVNNTSYVIETSWISSIIISELNRSGKVRAMSEDQYMKQKEAYLAAWNSENGLDSTPTFADITLSGKIYEAHQRTGRNIQKTYMFRLELNKDGIMYGPWRYEVKKSRSY